MGNSIDGKDGGSKRGVSESPEIDDKNSLDHLLDKPPSAREYFKTLVYFVIVVIFGVLIAILVFFVNK